MIDEWDCIFREFKNDKEAQKAYLGYLRLLLKEKPYVELAYMTGILPIKKYGTHSALNMFDEISMLDAKDFSEYMGFTGQEVEALCESYGIDFAQMKEWYDGLKDAIIRMLAGDSVRVNIRTFQNSMDSFVSKDDVMTLLIHLGYLGYQEDTKEAYIPNYEVENTFIDSIENSNWNYITKVFQNSNDLLEATWNMQEDRVAAYIQGSHYETSILQYNDENALAYTVNLAYITAREYYTIVRELPAGKGFADIVFIPKKDKPAMVVELKYDKSADTGIRQILEKRYALGLEKYLDHLLLVSISYEKQTKEHECVIARYQDGVR